MPQKQLHFFRSFGVLSASPRPDGQRGRISCKRKHNSRKKINRMMCEQSSSTSFVHLIEAITYYKDNSLLYKIGRNKLFPVRLFTHIVTYTGALFPYLLPHYPQGWSYWFHKKQTVNVIHYSIKNKLKHVRKKMTDMPKKPCNYFIKTGFNWSVLWNVSNYFQFFNFSITTTITISKTGATHTTSVFRYFQYLISLVITFRDFPRLFFVSNARSPCVITIFTP